MKQYKQFYAQHPYLNLLIVTLIASIVGIAIEWWWHQDFIGSGIFVTIGIYLVGAWQIKKNRENR